MEKLNVHETLRIYLPGLLFTLIVYFTINLTLKDANTILIPAIFVALLINAIIWKFHIKAFNKIADQNIFFTNGTHNNYMQAWKDILSERLNKYQCDSKYSIILNSEEGADIAKFIVGSYFSKKYDLMTLNYFRSPKSFGIMCYNLAVVCAASAFLPILVPLYKMVWVDFQPDYYYYPAILLVLLFSAYYFKRSSDHFFIQSLTRETAYWKQLNSEEINEVTDLIDIYEKFKTNPDLKCEQ